MAQILGTIARQRIVFAEGGLSAFPEISTKLVLLATKNSSWSFDALEGILKLEGFFGFALAVTTAV